MTFLPFARAGVFAWLLVSACAGQTNPPGETHIQGLPEWLYLGGEIRGRAEGFSGVNEVPGFNNFYYLHRIRINASVGPFDGFRFFAQAQDSRAPGYSVTPVPSTVVNPLDLRQAYVEFDPGKNGHFGFRVGRQELSFGEERLVGASNWGNVSRNFDAARVIYHRDGLQADAFASAVVVNDKDRFDRPHFNNKFYGLYTVWSKWVPKGTVEPYFFLKTNSSAKGELGALGNLRVYTYGFRALGKLPARFDYNTEMALERGNTSVDPLKAWAGHWVLGYTPSAEPAVPRLVLEYNFASGDRNLKDGERGTFDQLYPTNHNKYGTGDRIGWRNIRDLMGGLEWKPTPRWRVNLDYHSFWLANVNDALYLEAGGVFVRNSKATSAHIGTEIDLQAMWRPNTHWQLGFGYAHLFPGEYLKQSTPGSPVTGPYGTWQYAF